MINKYEKKNIDGCILIEKTLMESIKKMNISNQELFMEINNGAIDSIKSISELNISIARICMDEMSKSFSELQTMIEPMTEATKKIYETYESLNNSIFTNITRIFESVDWKQFDLLYKEIAIIHLSNGFYPYWETEVNYNELLNNNSRNKQISIMKKGIKLDINNKKKKLLEMYPRYKHQINESYKLFKDHKYRLCILSLINIISIINNSQFEYIDFTDFDKVRQKLVEKEIMKKKETNYLLFSPYIEDETLKKQNMILISCKKNPRQYLKIKYNRNAILHGYSEKFGNETNCLRWFSVLFNTMEISRKIMELNTKQ